MSKPSGKSREKVGRSSKPIPDAKLKCARDAYQKLQALTGKTCKTLSDIDQLITNKAYQEIIKAIDKDIDEVTGWVTKHTKSVSDIASVTEGKAREKPGMTATAKPKDEKETTPIESQQEPLLEILGKTIYRLRDQYNQLQKECVAELGKINMGTIVGTCAKCETLKNKIKHIEDANEEKIQKLKIEWEEQKGETETELQQCEKDRADLKQQLGHLEEELKRIQQQQDKKEQEWSKEKIKLQEQVQKKDEIQKLKSELEEQQSKNEARKIELQQCEKERNDLKQQMENLEEELKEIQEQQDKKEQEWSKEKIKLQEQARKKELPSSVSVSKDMQTYVRDLELRLATEMSSKVSSDESSLENISIKNRPMTIASDYELFCSQAWLTAKTALDDKIPQKEDDKVQFLTEVLVISENQAQIHFKEVKTWLLAMTQEPLEVKYTKSPNIASILKGKHLAKEEVAIIDVFRGCSDHTNLTVLEKSIKENMKKLDFTKKFSGKDETRYISACARLTWKMVMQRPPMRFGHDKKLKWEANEKVVELAWGSNPNGKNPMIKYYRHPILYHGDKVMVKGKVVIK